MSVGGTRLTSNTYKQKHGRPKITGRVTYLGYRDGPAVCLGGEIGICMGLEKRGVHRPYPRTAVRRFRTAGSPTQWKPGEVGPQNSLKPLNSAELVPLGLQVLSSCIMHEKESTYMNLATVECHESLDGSSADWIIERRLLGEEGYRQEKFLA